MIEATRLLTRQPQTICLRNADPLFGIWPWSRGPLWRMVEEWSFDFWDGSRWLHLTIPSSYEFDKASVPPILWGPPMNYTPDGIHSAAALEHDFLCDILNGGSDWLRKQIGELPKVTAPEVHAHFYHRMIAYGMRPSQAQTFYAGVRRLGPGGTWRPSSWFK